jgi:hypothetical protein
MRKSSVAGRHAGSEPPHVERFSARLRQRIAEPHGARARDSICGRIGRPGTCYARRHEDSRAGFKRSFLNRKHLQQCLDLAKRRVAKVDADNGDQLVQRQEAARNRLQREREAELWSALHTLNIIEQAKEQNETPAHVSINRS